MINALSKDVQLFRLQDSVGSIEDYLLHEELSTAFVVEDGIYQGAIALDLLSDLAYDKPIKAYSYLLKPDAIASDLHWFHAFELFSNFNSNILAVVDEDGSYQGVYKFEDLNRGILNLALIKQAGYIIVLSLDQTNSTYLPIVDIIERNGGKLLGILTTIEDGVRVELTIKISIQNCDRVLEALTRMDYQVLYSDASDHLKETLKDNAAYFNAYLNL